MQIKSRQLGVEKYIEGADTMNQDEFEARVKELEANGVHKTKLFVTLCDECGLSTDELKEYLRQLPNFGDYAPDFYAWISRQRKSAEKPSKKHKPKNPDWGQKGNVTYEGNKPKDYAPPTTTWSK